MLHCTDLKNLCKACFDTCFERHKGTIYSRADQYLATFTKARPTTAELRIEAAHWVRDLADDPKLLERMADEWICWLAIRSIMPKGLSPVR